MDLLSKRVCHAGALGRTDRARWGQRIRKSRQKNAARYGKKLEPSVGIEPTPCRLHAGPDIVHSSSLFPSLCLWFSTMFGGDCSEDARTECIGPRLGGPIAPHLC